MRAVKRAQDPEVELYGEGWSKYVPVFLSEDRRTLDIFLHDVIQMPCNYSEAYREILDRREGDVVNLYISNGGGVIDSAILLMDALEKTKAHTIAHISGTVASAATIITLACKEVRIAKYLQFMVHTYSHGTQGKEHEVKAYVEFSDKELNRSFREIYSNFLSTKEMDLILAGKDMWINEFEVAERLERRARCKELGINIEELLARDKKHTATTKIVSETLPKRKYTKSTNTSK
ncbi:MAG: ATP-dependent Clp protease proteolytic subunit [Prevotella sp.]